MKRTQYTAEFKAEAVKQIIEKGHPAPEVSSRLGVDEKPIENIKALQAEMTKLKVELRRTTKERDILKKPPRTLPKCPSEVRVYQRASQRVQTEHHVPSAKGAPQRLLRLAQEASVTPGSGERQVIGADPLLLRSKYGNLWQSTDLP
jgi:transposase